MSADLKVNSGTNLSLLVLSRTLSGEYLRLVGTDNRPGTVRDSTLQTLTLEKCRDNVWEDNTLARTSGHGVVQPMV